MKWCALCTADLPESHTRMAPFGKNEGLVLVCDECFDTHPRSGRYGFDSLKAPARTGNGNRRKGGAA